MGFRVFGSEQYFPCRGSVAPTSSEQFDSHPSADRMGLSFDEFCKVRGRYDAIAALPITSATGSVLGVISLDAVFDGAYSLLNKPAVHRILSDSARAAVWRIEE